MPSIINNKVFTLCIHLAVADRGDSFGNILMGIGVGYGASFGIKANNLRDVFSTQSDLGYDDTYLIGAT